MSKTTLTPDNEAVLQQKRLEIDRIDAQLVALLKQRIGIVQQVGELKKRNLDTNCYIRPAREAEIIRRIYGEFSDTAFNPAAAALIWRFIIAASTDLEQRICVSFFTTDLYRNDIGDFFSPIVDYHGHQSAAPVLQDMLAGKASVGILPYEAFYTAEVMEFFQTHRQFRVFVGLPCIAEDPKARLLAFAQVQPENSGDDRSLHYVANVSRETFLSHYPEARIADAGEGLLADLPGFEPGLSIASNFIGSYAVPIYHVKER